MLTLGTYRLQNPRRLTRAAAVFAIAVGFTLSSISGSVAGNEGPVALEYVTVQPGDSLWAMASDHAPNQDPRDWIAEVVMLNALATIELTPGQQIALP